MDQTRKTRDLFLSGISMTYMFAFISLFPQIPGLYGRNGIIPVASTIRKHVNAAQTQSADLLFSRTPTFVYFLPFEPENSMELLCLLGAFMAVISAFFKTWRNSYTYLAMYLLYLSLFKVGSSFLWFQWDTLLLEAGFLSIFVAPSMKSDTKANGAHHKSVAWFLVKWLMFRLMFASGVVKLTSGCHTWWKLTALNYHYESQCLPTQFAWWAHQLPTPIQKLSVIGTYVIEIALPLLFFSPLRSWRLLAGHAQIVLMLMIIATGNYNFFNFLTILLGLSTLDDENVAFLQRKLSFGYLSRDDQDGDSATTTKKRHKGKKTRNGWISRLETVFNAASLIAFLAICKQLFYYKDRLMITFTMDDLNDFLELVVPFMLKVSVLSFACVTIKSLYRCVTDESASSFGKIANVGKLALIIPPCVFLFAISMVPYLRLMPEGAEPGVRVYPVVEGWYGMAERYEVTHSYGLFRRMTGVGGRPELVVEGSNSTDGPWKEYDFAYKPGDVRGKPAWAAPHQPRLDWQMWFAALGQYQHNPWFVSFLHRLLIGQKEVLSLIERSPFPNQPPRHIRALLYKYHYTGLGEKSGDWWRRGEGQVYLSLYEDDHDQLDRFLDYHKLQPLGVDPNPDQYPAVSSFLHKMRTSISSFKTPYLLWSLAISIVVVRVFGGLH